MKKAAYIFLSAIFLVTSLGMTLNAHFCGEKLRSVSLTADDCCCRPDNMPADEKSKGDGCCKNKTQYVKITDQYAPASQFQVEKINLTPTTVAGFILPSAISLPISPLAFPTHPPPPRFPDIVISFRSLLI